MPPPPSSAACLRIRSTIAPASVGHASVMMPTIYPIRSLFCANALLGNLSHVLCDILHYPERSRP